MIVSRFSMNVAALGSILQTVSLLVSALMALKLWMTGLHRHYPVFFLYFVFRVPNAIWPLFFPVTSDMYAYIWAFTDPLVLIFYILLVVELYRLVLQRYPGLYTI